MKDDAHIKPFVFRWSSHELSAKRRLSIGPRGCSSLLDAICYTLVSFYEIARSCVGGCDVLHAQKKHGQSFHPFHFPQL